MTTLIHRSTPTTATETIAKALLIITAVEEHAKVCESCRLAIKEISD